MQAIETRKRLLRLENSDKLINIVDLAIIARNQKQ